MSLSRRTFPASAAAASVLQIGQIPEPVEVAAASPGATARAATYGYSLNDGEWWSNGFDTHAEALAEALGSAEPGQGFVTGLTIPHSMGIPDRLAEDVSEALCNGDVDIGEVLISRLQSWNEESDYEGDFDSACASASVDDLPAKAKHAVCAALARHGRPEWAELVEADIELPEGAVWNDPALEALGNDQALSKELASMLGEWADRHNLESELRMLDVEEEQTHEAPELSQVEPVTA